MNVLAGQNDKLEKNGTRDLVPSPSLRTQRACYSLGEKRKYRKSKPESLYKMSTAYLVIRSSGGCNHRKGILQER